MAYLLRKLHGVCLFFGGISVLGFVVALIYTIAGKRYSGHSGPHWLWVFAAIAIGSYVLDMIVTAPARRAAAKEALFEHQRWME